MLVGGGMHLLGQGAQCLDQGLDAVHLLGALAHVFRHLMEVIVDLGGGVKLEMIWIPGGTFDMGAELTTYERAKKAVAGWFGKTIVYPYQPEESPVHQVTLDGFWMGKTEVTQAQYKAIMGMTSSFYKGAPIPENI